MLSKFLKSMLAFLSIWFSIIWERAFPFLTPDLVLSENGLAELNYEREGHYQPTVVESLKLYEKTEMNKKWTPSKSLYLNDSEDEHDLIVCNFLACEDDSEN